MIWQNLPILLCVYVRAKSPLYSAFFWCGTLQITSVLSLVTARSTDCLSPRAITLPLE